MSILLVQDYLGFYLDDTSMLIFYMPEKKKSQLSPLSKILKCFLTFLMSSKVDDFGIPKISYKLLVTSIFFFLKKEKEREKCMKIKD